MKIYKFKNILLILFILASLLPFTILGTIVFKITTDLIRNDIIVQNNLLANAFLEWITHFVSDSVNDLMIFSVLLEKNIKENPKLIDELLPYTHNFTNVMNLNAEGIIINVWPANEDLFGMDMSKKDFLQKLKKAEGPFWSSVFMAPDTGDPSITLSMATSSGTVTAFISLSDLFMQIHESKLKRNISISVIDDKGVLIASNIEKFVLERKNVSNIPILTQANHGQTLVYKYEDKSLLGSVFFIPHLEWYFLVTQPVGDAFKTNRQILLYFFIGILILILVFIITVNFLTRRLRPLQKMVNFMNEIAESNYSTYDERSKILELEMLRNSFNSMSLLIKEREKNLEKLVDDKTVLLREVNHRVKNNLMMLSSLFSLQSDEIDDIHTKEILSDAQRRIESIALVHTMLYRGKELSEIDLEEYIIDLIEEINNSFQTKKVEINTEIISVFLSLEKAIPLGLIINELLTNIYKHAFDDSSISNPKIIVNSSVNSGFITISIKNNGKTPSISNTPDREEKMGMKLVYLLTDQIHGNIQFTYTQGATVLLEFPIGN